VRWTNDNSSEWKYKFAWLPTKVGEDGATTVWLEWYVQRYVDLKDNPVNLEDGCRLIGRYERQAAPWFD